MCEKKVRFSSFIRGNEEDLLEGTNIYWRERIYIGGNEYIYWWERRYILVQTNIFIGGNQYGFIGGNE